jgi:lambda repressor-like predicted transcriptional regulator
MTETKQRNERLAEAMSRAGYSSTDLAVIAECTPKTIDRLVANRFRKAHPHARHRIADAVQVPVGMLWPGAANGLQVTDELLAVYPSRAAMPSGVVMSLLSDATRQIDVLALAATWLWDVPNFASTLAAKARAGVAVRICLGEPSGGSARTRGAEEGIGKLLAARCELAANYARPVLEVDPGAIRLHDTTLYASILRFDDDLLVNWHLYGAPAAASPVLYLQVANTHGLAATIASSFERVWDGAQPLTG